MKDERRNVLFYMYHKTFPNLHSFHYYILMLTFQAAGRQSYGFARRSEQLRGMPSLKTCYHSAAYPDGFGKTFVQIPSTWSFSSPTHEH
jgi:hypothetical protein